jgi:hypothetical protein
MQVYAQADRCPSTPSPPSRFISNLAVFYFHSLHAATRKKIHEILPGWFVAGPRIWLSNSRGEVKQEKEKKKKMLRKKCAIRAF